MTRLKGEVEKGWGSETIFATNDLYCGKLLNFNRGHKCSMHMHKIKDETWHILSGSYIVRWIDTNTADVNVYFRKRRHMAQSSWFHKITCIKEGTIVEVSTADSVEDNYRVEKGDSSNMKDDYNGIEIMTAFLVQITVMK